MKTLLNLSLSCVAVGLTGCVVINVGQNPPREAQVQSKPTTQARARQALDIDFGPWRPGLSKQVGPAATGSAGDYWNCVGVPNNSHHTESGLRFAGGEASPIQVEMVNLGGGWSCGGAMGVKSPMLDDFNYPVNNQGGNSRVILHEIPAGKYQIYVYGHGTKPEYYGDYTLTVGGRSYGRKTTSHGWDAVENTKWVEGSQYVRFETVNVAAGEDLEILIQPGGTITDGLGRAFADAMICGLQLVPAR